MSFWRRSNKELSIFGLMGFNAHGLTMETGRSLWSGLTYELSASNLLVFIRLPSAVITLEGFCFPELTELYEEN